MRRIILSLAYAGLVLLPVQAVAQTPTPYPQSLPANSVVGRLGAGVPGPAEALPFSILASNIFGNIGAGHVLGNAGATSGTPVDTSLTALFDQAFCATNGQVISRVAGTWQCAAGGGGSGSVSSVGLSMPGIFTVTNSPVTTSGTLTATAAGTTGGVPYFSGATTMASSGTLTANVPVIGGGAGAAPSSGTRSGNTTTFATTTGTLTSSHCVQIDANGNLVDAGGACTTGGGGGTVNTGLINQLAWYAAGGTAVSGLATANSGVLVTSAGGVPSISTTIPATTQANITGTGTLTSGATGAGFTIALTTSTVTGILTAANGGTGVANGSNITLGGSLTTVGAFATTLTVTAATNSTLPAGTHTLAGLDVAQTFSALNQFTNVKLSTGVIFPTVDSTTAISIDKADGVTSVVDVDTTNARVGINRTPGAFDLDVNNTANVGGTLTFGVGTVTGLTVNNSPVGANDYFLYYSAAANAFRRCTVAACASAATAGVSSLNGTTGGLTLAASGTSVLITSGSTFTVTTVTAPQGRLTLQTGVPVMTTTQSAKTTLFYDCYAGGNKVPYFDGTNDQSDTIGSCEVSDAMVSAASAGQVVSGQVYDAWWVHSGTNRICLAMSASTGGGGGWASDTGGSSTVRGTGYSQLDDTTRPYTTNKNSITNCFNGATNYGAVSANQGTYLGTILASANGTTTWVYGVNGAPPTPAQFFVWNQYNRLQVSTALGDTTATWTYGSAAYRAINGDTTTFRVTYVMGRNEDAVTATFVGSALGGAGIEYATGFGVDSCTTLASGAAAGMTGGNVFASVSATFAGNPGAGTHFICPNEFATGGTTTAVVGSADAAQTGMTFTGRF